MGKNKKNREYNSINIAKLVVIVVVENCLSINLFIFLPHEQEEKKSLLSITGRIDIFFSSIFFLP
jgi:hypothetical protein